MIKSKAPFRIGLAGGGTDVPPYSTIHGGGVVNTSINLYVNISIEDAIDGNVFFQDDTNREICIAVYETLTSKFKLKNKPFNLSYSLDINTGSGLGTSSALIVALIGAYSKFFKLELKKKEIAELAIYIERIKFKQAGGKQDQYASTFGGVNYFDFFQDESTIEQLNLSEEQLANWASNLLLYDTLLTRKSGEIMSIQQTNVENHNSKTLESLNWIKQQAIDVKNIILEGKTFDLGLILNEGWLRKRNVSNVISNNTLDDIYNLALAAGSTGGKLLGAGGGGYMLFYCPNNKKDIVAEKLQSSFGGRVQPFELENLGLQVWEE